MDRSPRLALDEESMIRKNLTITSEEDDFLRRHREINQSALFRQAIVTLMQVEAEARPRQAKGRGSVAGDDLGRY